jgi:hypothetical protein
VFRVLYAILLLILPGAVQLAPACQVAPFSRGLSKSHDQVCESSCCGQACQCDMGEQEAPLPIDTTVPPTRAQIVAPDLIVAGDVGHAFLLVPADLVPPSETTTLPLPPAGRRQAWICLWTE